MGQLSNVRKPRDCPGGSICFHVRFVQNLSCSVFVLEIFRERFALRSEQGFESNMVHHTRNLVTNFPGFPPLSARTRLIFAAGRVSPEPHFIEGTAIPRVVSDPRKYFSKPVQKFWRRDRFESNALDADQSANCLQRSFASSVVAN